jgi:hypothetical protein
MRPSTQRALDDQFYREQDPRIRRRIVASFAESQTSSSKELLWNAGIDQAPSVRGAALQWLERLLEESPSKVARYLRDSDPDIRRQAIAVLQRRGAGLEVVQSEIAEAMTLEKDPEIKARLDGLLRSVKK